MNVGKKSPNALTAKPSAALLKVLYIVLSKAIGKTISVLAGKESAPELATYPASVESLP